MQELPILALLDIGKHKILMKQVEHQGIWPHRYFLDKIIRSVLICTQLELLLMSLWLEKDHIMAEIEKLLEKKCLADRPRFQIFTVQRYQKKE